MKKHIMSFGLLLLSGAALASDDVITKKEPSMYFPESYAKAGPIIGVDLGYLHHSIYAGQDDADNIHGRDTYFGSLSMNGYVGYNFQFNNYLLLGTEVGLQFLGANSYTTDEQEYNEQSLSQGAADILFTSHFYVYKGWNFFGKLGAALVFQDSENIIYKDNSEITMFRIRPEYALGLGYTFCKKTDIHFTYEHIGSESDADDIAATDALLFGVSYTF